MRPDLLATPAGFGTSGEAFRPGVKAPGGIAVEVGPFGSATRCAALVTPAAAAGIDRMASAPDQPTGQAVPAAPTPAPG